ncbi:MAG: Cysteine desulfurase, partial [uncultured Phycisphaerae bacterium]
LLLPQGADRADAAADGRVDERGRRAGLRQVRLHAAPRRRALRVRQPQRRRPAGAEGVGRDAHVARRRPGRPARARADRPADRRPVAQGLRGRQPARQVAVERDCELSRTQPARARADLPGAAQRTPYGGRRPRGPPPGQPALLQHRGADRRARRAPAGAV